jgi:hypothetical protein
MKKLRAPQGRRQRVSDEALRLWRSCLVLERQGAPKRFRAEYSDLGKRLAIECNLDWCSMMWPTTVKSAKLPTYLRHRHRDLQAEAYRQAYAARLALIEAEAAADREAEAENEQRPGPTT